MAMSKKDYELVAKTLSEAYTDLTPEMPPAQAFSILTTALAAAFVKENPNFKFELFVAKSAPAPKEPKSPGRQYADFAKERAQKAYEDEVARKPRFGGQVNRSAVKAMVAMKQSTEPQPGDGPEYHAEHQAYIERTKRR